ncbi:hypothetical protein EON80_20940, partial [bacterium]
MLSQRTDGYGRMAQALTPVLYALAAAYVAVKVAAAQAAVSQGIQAGLTGATSGLSGLAAVSGRLAASFVALKRTVSIFRFISASAGSMAAVQSILAALTASVSSLALAALPVLAAAIGIVGIGFEKYQEKASRVDAANAQLSYSSSQLEASFKSLSEVSAIAPGSADAVQRLTDAFKALDGSVASLERFKSLDLPKAQQSISLNTKLKPLERQVLLDEIARIQRDVDDQLEAARFKIDVEAQANPTSLTNLLEAFTQTYGDIYDAWYEANLSPMLKATEWAFGQIRSVASTAYSALAQGMSDLRKGLADAWYQLTGGFESGLNRMIRGISDSITGLMGHLLSSIQTGWSNFRRWFAGQSANAGETDGPELPGFGAGYIADQKRRNAAYRNANGGGWRPQVFGPPARPVNAAAQRRARLMGLNAVTKTIPHFDPTSVEEKEKKKRGRSEAEKAADRERRASLAEERDALSKSARARLDRAKVIEETARREIDRIKAIRDSTRELFGGMQKDLLALGILNDPLAPLLKGFEKLIGFLDQAAVKAAPAARAIQRLTDGASTDRENIKRMRYATLRNPKASVSRGTLAPADPSMFAVVTLADHGDKLTGQAKKLSDDVQREFGGLTRSFYAVPTAWGKAVKDSEGYSARFRMQTHLATAEG